MRAAAAVQAANLALRLLVCYPGAVQQKATTYESGSLHFVQRLILLLRRLLIVVVG